MRSSPYLVPLLVLFVIYRRTGRTRHVRVNRLRVLPQVLLLATAWALAASGVPPVQWLTAYVLAAAAGAAIGYARSSQTHLWVDPETGNVERRQTLAETAILMGLFAMKFGVAMMYPELNGGDPPSARTLFTPNTVDAVRAAQHASHTAASINYATDTLLIFSTMVFVAGAAGTWQRAQRLMAEHGGENSVVRPTRPAANP